MNSSTDSEPSVSQLLKHFCLIHSNLVPVCLSLKYVLDFRYVPPKTGNVACLKKMYLKVRPKYHGLQQFELRTVFVFHDNKMTATISRLSLGEVSNNVSTTGGFSSPTL